MQYIYMEYKLIYSIEGFRAHIPESLFREDDIRSFVTGLKEGYEERAIVKLVVLGNGQIGKSTLVNYFRHCNKSWLEVWNVGTK